MGFGACCSGLWVLGLACHALIDLSVNFGQPKRQLINSPNIKVSMHYMHLVKRMCYVMAFV